MDLHIFQEQLHRKIKSYADQAVEARQVSKRLRELLPLKFLELKRSHRRSAKLSAKAERLALSDPNYTLHLDNIIEVSFSALHNRVQYETHNMLVQARQTLKAFRK